MLRDETEFFDMMHMQLSMEWKIFWKQIIKNIIPVCKWPLETKGYIINHLIKREREKTEELNEIPKKTTTTNFSVFN